MSNILRSIFLTSTFLFATTSVFADSLIASTGTEQVQLLELYSSESCSSCPPADAWVSSLQNQAGLWKKFVPVVFHVDYWNHLSWKDKFSSKEMTDRQYAISQQWGSSSVYTPAIVLDGEEKRNWRNTNPIEGTKPFKGIEISIYKVSENTIKVKIFGIQSGKQYTINAVKLGMGVSTDVKSGENSGQLLKHNFLVLDWNTKNLILNKENEQTFTFKADSSNSSRIAVAAWIEENGKPIPLQTVGGYL